MPELTTTPAPKIYIPPSCYNLAESKTDQQIRLGIQGYGGTGKTYGIVTTFPNPIVLNIDRGLSAHQGNSNIIEVPIWNDDFCRTIVPSFKRENLKDFLLTWLEKNGPKLTPDQTLVVDGNTGIQNAYHKWFAANSNMFLTKGGQVDGFAEWTVKKTYFGEIMEFFKTLKCGVAYLCHEIDQKDKNGPQGPSYSGKVRPLLTGAFGDEILTHFTDWFRQLARDKVDPNTIPADQLKLWGMSSKEFKEMQDSFSGNTIYYWQTESDSIFDAKRSSLVNCPRFIPADYRSFKKFQHK